MSKRDWEQGPGPDVAVLNAASVSVTEPLQPPQEQHRQPGRLRGKVAVIAGGESGREFADAMEREGAKAVRIAGDARDEDVCRAAVARTVETFGQIDILVNGSDLHGCFHMTKFALPHMKAGASIINAAPVDADGSIAAFTHAVSRALLEKGVHVVHVPNGGVVLNS